VAGVKTIGRDALLGFSPFGAKGGAVQRRGAEAFFHHTDTEAQRLSQVEERAFRPAFGVPFPLSFRAKREGAHATERESRNQALDFKERLFALRRKGVDCARACGSVDGAARRSFYPPTKVGGSHQQG